MTPLPLDFFSQKFICFGTLTSHLVLGFTILNPRILGAWIKRKLKFASLTSRAMSFAPK